MSVLGTGAAAGVAQAAHTAQQVARKDDKRKSDRTHATRRIQDLIETHLLALDEGDEDSIAQLHVDEQLPEHQLTKPIKRKSHRPEPSDTENLSNQDDPESTLYHHLDIQA